MSIHFLHVRKLDNEGAIETKGGTTFAFEVEDGVGTLRVKFAAAHCHGDKQNFDRKIGRLVAEGRYKKGREVNTISVQCENRDGLFAKIRGALAELVAS